jgi:hypothetical protein
MSNEKTDARGQAALERFAANLAEMRRVWQLTDDVR